MTDTAVVGNLPSQSEAAFAAELSRQVREELGGNFTPSEHSMALQKYGLATPQFTASENNLILREARQESKRR